MQNDLPTYYRLWSDVYVAIASQLVVLRNDKQGIERGNAQDLGLERSDKISYVRAGARKTDAIVI